MLLNNLIDYRQLIQFTAHGIEVADYNQIRTAVSNRFKEIYGSDIDLSTASADGEYVEMYCLMINNILQSFKGMYTALDPRTAQGMFLDILASFTNVSRKPATRSTVALTITNVGTTDVQYHSIDFIDKNGTIWTWESDVKNTGQAGYNVTFTAGQSYDIIATCSEVGPVRADAGWITQTVESINFTVAQSQNASIGSYKESDTQLRARRNDALAIRGTTVLESLNGALLSLNAIDDVVVYENATQSNVILVDTTTLLPHSVYVCLRQKENIVLSDQMLGTIIFEKLTPGIQTVESTAASTNGESHSYDYDTGTGLEQLVYWKKCKPISPEIKVTITPLAYFASTNNSTATRIATYVADYMNSLGIGKNVNPIDVQIQAMYADPTFRGLNTYIVKSVTINGTNTEYENPITYYKYSGEVSNIAASGSDLVLTII